AKADVDLAKSRVISAEAAAAAIGFDIKEAERVAYRTRSLAEAGHSSEASLGRDTTRLEVLRSQLSQALAQIETARMDVQRATEVLNRYTIYAPFAGVVTERIAEPGEIVAPIGTAATSVRTGICTIVDRNSLEVEVDINQTSLGKVHLGQL